MTENIAQRAVEIADQLLAAALAGRTNEEQSQSARMGRMMSDPKGKAFTVHLADKVFRSARPKCQAAAFRALLEKYGPPAYLTSFQRGLLRLGAVASKAAPAIVMRGVASQLRRDTAGVILSGEPEPLARYLAQRRAEGTGVIVNQLGEAILGDEEAARRLEQILAHLANPDITAISVKISAIFSQINLLDWEGSVAAICERLRKLYRAALPNGKFVNLDMEEYRDLRLTLDIFQRTLGEPEFRSLRAGIVLQAYLPDSWAALRELTEWAQNRVAAGGAPIKVRIVKGANLAMEAVEAELHDWRLAPYGSKADTDANFRRMLDYGCEPDRARAVNLGVGSHNLFDIALALALREERQTAQWVEVEMLEGMANHQARAVQKAAGGLLVYAPVVRHEDFNSALAYLIRRLDENTSPENFLRDSFALTAGGDAWTRQRARFLAGWEERKTVAAESNRALPPPSADGPFHNAVDTDWTQVKNRAALDGALARWREPQIPAPKDLNAMLNTARAAQPGWEEIGPERRAALLRNCAKVMEAGRFDTIAVMVRDANKASWEADVEVSEAVDFANYYACGFPVAQGARAQAVGVVVIAPPWNFPYAIPCSGVLAALMAGNAVALKPAPETAATAWRLAQQLWEAGIPRDVLQFFPCDDGATGKALINDPRVALVVLTGAYETARLFLGWRPSLSLFAETSGKNAILVTAQADRDLAIKDLVKSAFGHSGQKCSAASLGILEAEVYDDPGFLAQLRDAASSLRVGPSTHPASVVTPLIRPPGDSLRRALTSLDEGEAWLLEPRQIGDDPGQWSPGIKLGVKPGGWFHRTECFGPVLGLMRANDFEEALRAQNDCVFGLTAGIHSLDEREVAHWRERVEAGNIYINRPITGAVVQRQPFGGWKRSCFGPGAKAGGPNYAAQFARFEETGKTDPDYERCWSGYFSKAHDPSALRCESNVFRYRPCRGVILRLEERDEHALELAHLAARTCGVRLHLSIGDTESEHALAERLPALAAEAEFLRTVNPPSGALLAAAYEAGLNWIDAPLLPQGRLELVHWLREQSVSETRHRYGLII